MDLLNGYEAYSVWNILARLLLATLMGGVIGTERGVKRKHAGLRTFALVCLGAALAMIVNEYLAALYPEHADPGRMAAQVISGMGFLGVGTIVVTGKNYVRGLTTAASLWTTAILGLTVGAGLWQIAVAAFLLIMLITTLLTKWSRVLEENSPTICLTMELEKDRGPREVLDYMLDKDYIIRYVEKNAEPAIVSGAAVVTMEINLKKRVNHEAFIKTLMELDFVYFVEER